MRQDRVPRRPPGADSALTLEGVPERPEEIDATLQRLGVRPTRARGQSFLTDAFVADAEAALVDRSSGGRIVEIGGGLGLLTRALIRRGDRPTVVERDPRLVGHLRRVFGSSIDLHAMDALEFNWRPDDRMVGNLPFVIGTPLIVRALKARIPQIVVLLQAEVAERIAAVPGGADYGRLSILVRLYATPELFQRVPSRAFYPPPEVDGQIATLTARSGDLPVPSVDRLESIVRALFSGRRKQLGNLLPKVAGSRSAAALARTADWPEGWERRRPQELPPEAYFRLAAALS
ncbi:MAG: 16S rRNA (adenine(1518)-N(6)/adenine(1519)-N(6))-dimethyltransferase RsmA [Thermoplasmata archaeon]